MLGHGRKNKYEIIKQAIENEISIDEYLIEKFSLKKNVATFKIARFKDKIPVLLSLLLLPIIPFYYLIQICFGLKNEVFPKYINDDSLFLSFTRSPKIIELYKTYAKDLPYIQCVHGSKLHFIRHLSFTQLISGYFVAMGYSLKFIAKTHPRYYLHSLNIFELVLFLSFLENLKSRGVSSLTLTNHFDRWVTLIIQSQIFEISIIQHGMIDEKYSPKNKLRGVKSIKVFNRGQLKIFNQNIYNNNVSDVSYIKVNLNIDISDRCEILIISNPFFIDAELKIYDLLKGDGSNIKFRPHPLYINEKIIQEIDVTDLCLGARLPAPDFCICRNSTLGNEYEMMGYKVIWWDDDTTIEQIITVVRG